MKSGPAFGRDPSDTTLLLNFSETRAQGDAAAAGFDGS
jgi:hypothetical protein